MPPNTRATPSRYRKKTNNSNRPTRYRSTSKTGATKIRRSTKEAYTEFWEKIKAAVKSRDGHKCTKCPCTEGLTVDHIIPIASGGKTVMSNLRTLCFNCHIKVTKGRSAKRLLRACRDNVNKKRRS